MQPAGYEPADRSPIAPCQTIAVVAARLCFRGYPVLVRRVSVGGRAYELLGPANYDQLPDNPHVVARFEKDEYIPYWADLWPAAIMLANQVAKWPEVIGHEAGPRVLELGCGLGLAGIVAAARGYRVTLSDYDEDALAFAAESARRNGLPVPETRLIDWRGRCEELAVDRILAADVLYETRNLVPIADFVRNHLSRDGDSFALIADPNRTTAEAFDGIARHSGLSVEILTVERPDLRGGVTAGRVFCLRVSGEPKS